MDLAKFEQQDVCDYQLIAPDGEKLDVVFQLAGVNHPKRKARDRTAATRAIREFNRKGKAQLEEDPDELRDKQTDMLVACTLGWKNLEVDGKPVEFSEADARKLYNDPRFDWVRGRVNDALQDVENFMRSSSPA